MSNDTMQSTICARALYEAFNGDNPTINYGFLSTDEKEKWRHLAQIIRNTVRARVNEQILSVLDEEANAPSAGHGGHTNVVTNLQKFEKLCTFSNPLVQVYMVSALMEDSKRVAMSDKPDGWPVMISWTAWQECAREVYSTFKGDDD